MFHHDYEKYHDPRWEENLTRGKKGLVEDTIQNWMRLFFNHPELTSIRYNKRGRISVKYPEGYHIEEGLLTPINEYDELRIRNLAELDYNFKHVTKSRMNQMVRAAASEREFDPVVDYLESLEWDRQTRLATALPGSTGTRYDYELARKVFVVAAQRAMYTGSKVNRLPVFYCADSDVLRSWLSRVGKNYTGFFYTYGKRVIKDASRYWLAVFDISKYTNFDSVIKFWYFAQRPEDVVYGRFSNFLARNWDTWAVTTRPELFEKDPSKGRRFLIEVPADTNLDRYTPEYIDQIWAEAVHEAKKGYNTLLYIEDLKKPGGELGYL